MASYTKFQDFVEQLGKAVHNFSSHTFKAALTNTAPVNTQTGLDLVTDHPPPAAANGYTTGGNTLTVAWAETSGTAKATITDTVFTATAGGIGPFRYAIIYNDTATSPADALVAYYDYASSITPADTETFTIDFDGTNGFFQLA
jgi:hypothetical protein